MNYRLRKIIYILLTFVLLLSSLPITVFAEETEHSIKWPTPPEITSGGAVVIEASTGAILYDKNAYEAFHPASTTKLMTSLLAIEQSLLSEIVTCSHDAIYSIGWDSSRAGLVEGEQIDMENALYAILLASANEVSYAVAEHVGGTLENFVSLMNQRARELGCINTHFVNPHGLDDPDHYSSPYDLALIARQAIEYTTFRRISGSYYHQMPATNLNVARDLGNTHKIIRKRISYEGVFAGKTGTTSQAGSCLVTCAERNGMTLICAIMKAPNSDTVYDETIALLDYGFKNFTLTPLAASETESKNAFPMLFEDEEALISDVSSPLSVNNTSLVLPKEALFSDLTKEVTLNPTRAFSTGKNTIGEISYYYADNYVGCADILYYSIDDVVVIPTATPTPAITDATTTTSDSKSEALEKDSTTTNAVNVTTEDSNLRGIIIAIIAIAVVLVISLYIIMVELPYRKRRKAYYRKWKRK